MKRVQRLSLRLWLGFVIMFVPFTGLGEDGKEGQTIFTSAMGQPTRRFDVDTQWTREINHIAGKEIQTPARLTSCKINPRMSS
jgi:hypothetical protein